MGDLRGRVFGEVNRQLQRIKEHLCEGKAPDSETRLIADTKYNFGVSFGADGEEVRPSRIGA
jgi:hypothetical protein